MMWAEQSSFLQDVADEDESATPALAATPEEVEVPVGGEFYMDVFNALSCDRSISMGGLGPIPWSSIDRYAARLGLVGDYFDLLTKVIRALDVTYLNHLSEKRDRAAK